MQVVGWPRDKWRACTRELEIVEREKTHDDTKEGCRGSLQFKISHCLEGSPSYSFLRPSAWGLHCFSLWSYWKQAGNNSCSWDSWSKQPKSFHVLAWSMHSQGLQIIQSFNWTRGLKFANSGMRSAAPGCENSDGFHKFFAKKWRFLINRNICCTT